MGELKAKAAEAKSNNRFRITVLEGLMFLATERGMGRLPSMWEFITSEIVGGTYEFILDKEFEDTWVRFRGMCDDWWEKALNKRLNVVDGKKVKNKIDSALAEAIRHWTHLYWVHDRDTWFENALRHWFLFGDFNHMCSTFALTVPDARKIELDLKELDSNILRQMEGIAEKMRKYIRRDLDYIKRNYRW